MELFEPAKLGLVAGDDHLAAPLVRDAPFVAVARQRRAAGYAGFRLERAGRVVDAGVDDPAIVAGLVPTELRLLLEDDQSGPGSAPDQLAGSRQADDPTAYDRNVTGPVSHARATILPELDSRGLPSRTDRTYRDNSPPPQEATRAAAATAARAAKRRWSVMRTGFLRR